MKKLTQQEAIEKAKFIHGNKYDYSKFEYKGGHIKAIIICPVHGEFQQTPAEHFQGKGCKRCACSKSNESRKINEDEFIRRSKEKHGDKFDYTHLGYKSLQEKVTIGCPVHGDFLQKAAEHMGGAGCRKCADEANSKNYTIDTCEIEKRCNEVHDHRYVYDFTGYKNTTAKIKIKCPEHGWFEQVTRDHLGGSGCIICGTAASIKKRRAKIEDILEQYHKIYGDRYDYSGFVNYERKRQVIDVRCKKHDLVFHPTVENHLRGAGCPECGKEKSAESRTTSFEEYINRCIVMHGDKFLYDESTYKNLKSKIRIYCKEHDRWFDQHAGNHMNGEIGCPQCYSTRSRAEEEIFEYVKTLCPDAISSNRTVLNGKEIDIYVPSKKIAIEYDGLYWHNELNVDKNMHLNKTKDAAESGIQLIHVFEDEWKNKKDIVKSMLAAKLGCLSHKLYARKLTTCVLDNKFVRDFYNLNHIQGGNITAKLHIGLIDLNGGVWSVMSFDQPNEEARKLGRWILVRFASVLNYNVVGAAGKLLNCFEKNYKYHELITFADLRWSVGNLYDKLGFVKQYVTDPGYYVVQAMVRKHRFLFRKEALMKNYDCPPEMSEHEFCLQNKWYRIYDCGKIVYKKINL